MNETKYILGKYIRATCQNVVCRPFKHGSEIGQCQAVVGYSVLVVTHLDLRSHQRIRKCSVL
jgi:hypothetical protein